MSLRSVASDPGRRLGVAGADCALPSRVMIRGRPGIRSAIVSEGEHRLEQRVERW